MTVHVGTGMPFTGDNLQFLSLQGSSATGTPTSTAFDTENTQFSGVWRFQGTGFADFVGGIPTTGTISSVVYIQNGQTVFTTTAANLPILDFFRYIAANDPTGLVQFIFAGDDSITGSAGSENLEGYGGNDIIQDLGGNNFISGGDGDDTIAAGSGSDQIHGDAGNDVISGGDGTDRLYGDAGNDTLNGGAGNDELYGGDGNNTLNGEAGDDLIVSAGGVDIIDGGAGSNRLQYNRSAATSGYAITASASGFGLSDGSTIRNIGTATFTTGSGSDTLTLAGATAFSTSLGFFAGSGVDRVVADLSWSGFGVTLSNPEQAAPGTGSLTTGDSRIGVSFTGVEQFSVIGGAAADLLTGGAGNDALSGGAGRDQLTGGAGDDILDGGADQDFLFGGAGHNTLNGGDGDDYINSQGIDIVDGGLGDDRFVYDAMSATTAINFSNTGFSSSTGVTLASGTTVRNIESVIFWSGSGNDTYTLTELSGASGSWSAGAGTDRLIVNLSASNQSVSYGTSGPRITAGAGVFTFTDVESIEITGGSAGDVLSGGAAADAFSGGGGNDGLSGFGGDDLLDGGGGDDYLSGGDGIDTVTFASATAGVTVTLGLNTSQNTGAGSDFIASDIENLTGSAFADTLRGSAGANVLSGAAGDDLLIGGAGADRLDGGSGQDRASYQGASASVVAFLGSASINAGDAAGDTYAGIELLQGTSFGDILGVGDRAAVVGVTDGIGIEGMGGNDLIFGSRGQDYLYGGDGDDTIDGQGGADYVDGGAGVDTATFYSAGAGVWAFLDGSGGNVGDSAGTVYFSIENLTGSEFSDTLAGTAQDNAIGGSAGDDTIYGRAGNDVLDGGAGNDTLQGEDGSDYLAGREGNDTLNGGAGFDVLEGGAGGDTMDGGDGIDVAFYRNATAGVTANMSNPSLNTGDAAGDTYANIENIWGSDFNDTLTGSSIGGQVYGFAGTDVLTGSAVADVFYGGLGSDTITTGAGADDIFYLRYDGSSNEGGDTITDFAHGVDHITVSRFWFGFGSIGGPAAALTGANADFITSGATASSARPTFFYNATTGALAFDPDGAGAGAVITLATLQAGAGLTLSDIWTA